VSGTSSVYRYFHSFIDWIDETFDFPWVDLIKRLSDGDLSALNELKEIGAEFSVDSIGCFMGCIGAIDGLATRIKCPSNVTDFGNYFCRKNFYALNVQAICDRKERILWISPGHQGSTHDSTAWHNTHLKSEFEKIHDILKAHGLFIVGDSAYPLSAYLQVPYYNAKPGSPEDAFNFWLSNSRIQIECTFGKFISRFGIFWRTLKFDLFRSVDIIKASAKLLNFLVDCRENMGEHDMFLRNLSFRDVDPATKTHAGKEEDVEDMTFPLVTDNTKPKPSGRPVAEIKKREADGRALRDNICTSLYASGNVRPKAKRMKYNDFGHAYFE